MPDIKCQICSNTGELLENSPWLARINCLADTGPANFSEYSDQCLARAFLGLNSLADLNRAFQDRRFDKAGGTPPSQ